jgi:riboflavin biosynthesis pyrimidine reductase
VRPMSLPSMVELQLILKEAAFEDVVLYVEPSILGQSNGRIPVKGTGVAPTRAVPVFDAVEEAELADAGVEVAELDCVAELAAGLVELDNREDDELRGGQQEKAKL